MFMNFLWIVSFIMTFIFPGRMDTIQQQVAIGNTRSRRSKFYHFDPMTSTLDSSVFSVWFWRFSPKRRRPGPSEFGVHNCLPSLLVVCCLHVSSLFWAYSFTEDSCSWPEHLVYQLVAARALLTFRRNIIILNIYIVVVAQWLSK